MTTPLHSPESSSSAAFGFQGWLTRLSASLAPQTRNAMLIAALIALAHIVAAPYYLYLDWAAGGTSYSPVGFISFALGVLFGVGAFLSWRGQPTLGMALVLIALAASYPPLATLVSGLGQVLGIALLIGGPIMAFQTMPRRPAWLMTLATSVGGVATIYLDLFGAATRPALPGLFIQLLALAVVGLLAYTVIRLLPGLSLRLKLTLAFLGVALIPLALVGYFISQNITTLLEARAAETLRAEAVQTASDLDAFITTALRTVRAQAQYSDLAALLVLPADQRATSPERIRVARLVRAMAAQDDEIASVALLDLQGRVVYDNLTGNVGGDESSADYFREAARTQLPFASTVRNTYSVEGLTFGFAAPVRNQQDIVGYLRVLYLADKLQSLVLEHSDVAGRQLSALLLDENRVRVADAARPDLAFTAVGLLSDEQVADLQAEGRLAAGPPEEVVTLLPSLETGLRHATEQPSFTAIAYPDADWSQVAVASLETRPWQVVVTQPRSVFLTPLASQGRTALFVILLIAVGVALAAIPVAQLLAQPVARLTAAVRRVAEGDLTAEAPVGGGDEFGLLATTFNDMTRQVRETQQQLETRVQARTRDLELAAEVGQSLARARDLNELLGNAVDLIRQRFGLYHAQVYLLDSTGRTLLLRASSGEVGAELLRRRHQLPLGFASLNGRAASERRPILVEDTLNDPGFKANVLLPETRSEAAIPLIAKDRVVGVLDLQSTEPKAFTLENLPAFQTLAGLLTIGIENAQLLAETEAARQDVEAQSRRLTRAGWQEFLDAIQRRERLVHHYGAELAAPGEGALAQRAAARRLTLPIEANGETIGALQLEADPGQTWSEDDQQLAAAVARQVGEQVDNLRLIAQAEEYRAEAEEAVRRLTREGWLLHLAEAEKPPAYVYDGERVVAGSGAPEEPLRVQPLTLHGERLGEIAIEAGAAGPEAEQIVSAVAEQLTAHIENLRLSLQTEQALAENQKRATQLARLSEMEQSLSLATNEDEIITAIRPAFHTENLAEIILTYVTGDERGRARTLDAAAIWAGGRFLPERLPALQNVSLEQHPLTLLWVTRPGEPTYIGDVTTDPRASEAVRALARQEGWRSMLLLPLRSGGQWQGLLAVTWTEPRALSADEAFFADRLMETVAGITASRRASLAQQQALAENVRRNEELTALNRIVTTAASARDVTSLLQTTVQEVAELLRTRSAGFGLLEPGGQHLRIVADYSRAAAEPSAVGVLIPVEGNLSTQRVIETRRALVVNDAQTNPLTAPIHELMRERRTQALLVAPLIVRGEVIGTLGVDLDEPGRTFAPEEVALVETLAGQLAGAINNLRLYDEAQRRAQRERLINDITQKIQGTATVPNALQTAIQELGLALKAKRTRVELSPPPPGGLPTNGH